MPNSLLIVVDGANSAEHIDAWLPVLVTAGFQRATLFHAVREDDSRVADALDALRPLLDRLASALSAHGIDTDVALKRGDVVKWLSALADVRKSDLIAATLTDDGDDPDYLDDLCAMSKVPVLVLPVGAPRTNARLSSHARLARGEDAGLESAATALLHATLEHAKADDDWSDASLLVMGPTPSDRHLAELLGKAPCPVLLFSSHVLGVPARAT